MKKTYLSAAIAITMLGASGAYASLADGLPYSVNMDSNGFMIDGQYRLLRGGTVQWFRIPSSEWRDRLEKFKAAGFNTVDLYVAWNSVEPREGQFNFNTPNLRQFILLCKELGLYVYLR
ncbi:MAG TPA: beta-galactosidase, partial [Agitococcus sp.]|nr:beta-galactosidase [Agitococcus sp.]